MKNAAQKICLCLLLLLTAAANSNLTVAQQKKAAGKKPEMVFIAGATFEMGTDQADIPRLQRIFNIKRAALFEEETPRRKVRVDSYYIDKTEVTNKAFEKFLDKNPAWRKARWWACRIRTSARSAWRW